MDANNRESAADVASTAAGTAARMKRSITDKASEAKDALSDLGRKAADKFEDSRQNTASALDRTATSLHSGSDQLSDLGHTAADRLQSTADYLRETDLKNMGQDIQDLIRRYPAQCLGAAAVLGFLIARGLRRND
jgi:ElaB/YqjD/DUF883 family membrane-anchored ribosome-binding protein